jgi:RNA polymerase sigma-70 factor (ECF subfamily)
MSQICFQESAERPTDRRARREAASEAMARYASGDASSFNDVYRGIAPYLQKYLLRQTRDRSLASDLLQQALLQIHATRSRFQPGADVFAWAITIARRVLIDDVRRNRRRPEAAWLESTDHPDRASAPDDTVHARSLGILLQEHLAGLPDAQRVAFELLKVEGLAIEEIAERLGTTTNAAKLRAHRALVALRSVLASEMGNPQA